MRASRGHRSGPDVRYLSNMNFSANVVKNLTWVVMPLLGVLLCTSLPLHAQPAGHTPSATSSAQAIEGGSLLSVAAPSSVAKPVAGPDLRTVLQMQKTRPSEAGSATAPALPGTTERHLSTQERTELREQLRHQTRQPRDGQGQRAVSSQ